MDLPKSSDLFEMELTKEEAALVNYYIPVRFYPKGTVLLEEGQIADESYYVIQGLIRSYVITSEGEDRTTEFYLENDSCAVLDSYVNQKQSLRYLECMEDCVLCCISQADEQELIEKFPVFESLCRVEVEKDFGKAQEKMAQLLTLSPEQRYTQLLEERPQLIQRVPQYHLASYLGIKPESLSRIRKRMIIQEKLV